MTIVEGDWPRLQPLVAPVRHAVFVIEQGVPESLEWDEDDATATHVALLDDSGHVIGCARVTGHCHIGRMAVLPHARGKGAGMRLLQACLARLRDGGQGQALLNAQTHAVGFYERAGFFSEGHTFMDAGIPHVAMRKRLLTDSP